MGDRRGAQRNREASVMDPPLGGASTSRVTGRGWIRGSASLWAEVAENPPRVIPFPGLVRLGGGVLLVKADEQVGQLAADRLDAEHRGQLRQVDQPVRIPAGPIIIGAIDNPEDTMVDLAYLVQQAADLLQ